MLKISSKEKIYKVALEFFDWLKIILFVLPVTDLASITKSYFFNSMFRTKNGFFQT